MNNRIKEFRVKKGFNQKECTKAFNKYLNTINIKSISTSAFSRWENGISNPTKKMWANLADFFNTKPIVLQGALSHDEIIKIIQDCYNLKIPNIDSSKEIKGLVLEIKYVVTELLIGFGKINSENPFLSPKDNNFKYWSSFLNIMFVLNDPVLWLITSKPVNLNEREKLILINNALHNYLRLEKRSKNFMNSIQKWNKNQEKQK